MSLSNLSPLGLPFQYNVTLDAIVVPLAILVCFIQIFCYSVNLYSEYFQKSNKINVLLKNSSNNHEQYSIDSSKVEDDDDDDHQRSICIDREDMDIVLTRLGFTAVADENLNTDLSCWFEEVDNRYYYYKLDEVKAVFDVFDENKDGFIDAYELQRVLCVLGFKEGLDLESCQKMIMVAKAHVNGDQGRLDFNEFQSFLEKGLC